MEMLDVMKARHSVRQYRDTPLSEEEVSVLEREIAICNQEGGLHIQLVKDEPKAFDGSMAHYGKFKGVRNYIALIGKKGNDLEERLGYYGERLVLKAQELGLNSCWVALTYKKIKTAFTVNPGEKLVLVIALGHGETQGVPHKSKSVTDVVEGEGPYPEWFLSGVEASLLAPTAMNQQKFAFSLNGDTVSIRPGKGFYTLVDLGIAKYHFELGAGKESLRWEDAK